jgi:hypothetical protein
MFVIGNDWLIMDIWKQYFYASLNSKENVDEEVIYQGPKEQFEPAAKMRFGK